MMKYLLLIIFLIWPAGLFAGTDQALKPCSGDQYNTLDFWLGDWDVSWQGGGGTNNIVKTHGGCVVNEDFNSPGLQGMSISIYDKTSGKWRQTWMDNQGSYFDFYGHKDGDNYIFQTTPDPQKPLIRLRMVFTDIKSSSLTWLWQKTTDGGKDWQEVWKIYYSRKK